MSNTPGDWSLGSPFGKGDKGDKGDTGNSIVNTVFTSTTDPSGLAGQSGATDTYTINYNNLETDIFTIKNGNDGLATVIDTLEFEVLADNVTYTVNIDTTDGVFEVYFNGMLLPTSDYSLTGSTMIVNKAVVIGDEIIVKKIVSVDVLNTYSQVAIDTKIIEAGLQSKNYTDTRMATGNSATATKLHTPININGVSFDGSSDITVSDNTAVKLVGNQTIGGTKTFSSDIVGNVTGNLNGNATSATSATKLATPRQINGVNFDGSANITVVDSTKVALTGNETIAGVKTFTSTISGNITGNSGTATKLATARTINGVNFDGSGNITVSDSTAVKLTGNETIGGIKTFSSDIVGNITGNSGTATKLAIARTINGVAFDGTANIVVPTDLGIIAGTTAGPIVTSSSGTNATLPTASATASGVVTTGTQTIAGVKTFSSDIVGNVTGHASLDLSLTGGTMTGAITAIRETKVAMAANNIDLATGNLFTKTIIGATTLTISNALVAGNVNSFVLELTNGGSAVITWFSGVKWAGGTAPTLTASGKDILGFYSHDGGTTWNILGVNKDVK